MRTLHDLFKKPVKTSLLFSILCFLFFTNIKCKKNDVITVDQLPPATQTGAGTFGCLLNGVVWVPKSRFPCSSLSTTIQYDILNLDAIRANENIVFSVNSLPAIGIYNLTAQYNRAQYNISGNTC